LADEKVYGEPEVLNLVTTMFTQSMGRVEEALTRVHSRVDDLVQKDYITRTQCDQYRKDCSLACTKRLKELKGYPLSTVITVGVMSSVISGLFLWMIMEIAKIV
jgi:hypothetical protein